MLPVSNLLLYFVKLYVSFTEIQKCYKRTNTQNSFITSSHSGHKHLVNIKKTFVLPLYVKRLEVSDVKAEK